MSFLTTVRASLAPRLAIRPAYIIASGFHSSTIRSALNENDLSKYRYFPAQRQTFLYAQFRQS